MPRIEIESRGIECCGMSRNYAGLGLNEDSLTGIASVSWPRRDIRCGGLPGHDAVVEPLTNSYGLPPAADVAKRNGARDGRVVGLDGTVRKLAASGWGRIAFVDGPRRDVLCGGGDGAGNAVVEPLAN